MGPAAEPSLFYFYNTSVGDLTRYIDKYAKNDLKPTPGFVTNCFGVKIRKEFFPTILTSWDDIVEGKPIPSNFHADISEFGSVLRAVDLAKDKFNIMELGCGWGCWLNIGGKVAKDKGLKVHLYGVEGDPGHIEFAKKSLNDNGFNPDEYTIINGIASAKSGYALFPKQQTAGVSWSEAPVFDASKHMINKLLRIGYEKMEQVTINDILPSGETLDLLHMDIQGGETDLITRSIDTLNKKVAMMFVGTHSRTIEGELIKFLSSKGWVLEVERPAIIRVGGGIQTIVDGCQLWRNPSLIGDEDASYIKPIGSVKISNCNTSAKAGEKFSVDVTVKNNSESDWASDGPSPINLCYHWYSATDDSVVVYDGIRTEFEGKCLKANSIINQQMTVSAPNASGKYQLFVTAVQEGVRWFDTKDTWITDKIEIDVI